MSGLITREKQVHPFEVLPRSAGPSLDGWQAVLVERNNTERFIFRLERKEICEAILPLGTYRDVISRANLEFKSLIRALLKNPN